MMGWMVMIYFVFLKSFFGIFGADRMMYHDDTLWSDDHVGVKGRHFEIPFVIQVIVKSGMIISRDIGIMIS